MEQTCRTCKSKVVKPVKENKTADYNRYMNDYIKRKYAENKTSARCYKNTLNLKKRVNFTDEQNEKYNIYLHHIYKMKEMIDELPDGMFEKFLSEYKNLNFTVKE